MRNKWVLNYDTTPKDYKSFKTKSFDNKQDAENYVKKHNLTCYWISPPE